MSQFDEIRMQVMWNSLVSVGEEQALPLMRSAFQNSICEAGDLSAGVFNSKGVTLAQALSRTPGHVNIMTEAVMHLINKILRQNMFQGKIIARMTPGRVRVICTMTRWSRRSSRVAS